MSLVEKRLFDNLGITLPNPPGSLGKYVTVRRAGNLLYTSGGGPIINGKITYIGKIGSDLTVEEGQIAAREAAMYLLSALKEYIGDLDRIEGIIKVLAFVASAPDFYNQPAVIDGFSEVMECAFGEAGKHARSAVAVPQLPFNTPVEVEMIVQIRD